MSPTKVRPSTGIEDAKINSVSCTAYLIRHGATDNNLADPPILQGRSLNVPLSRQGCLQASAVAEALSSRSIAAIYASPLLRAQQTAAPLAERQGLPIVTVDEFTEVDVGAWESRNWADIEQSEPEAYHRFQADPARHGYRDGENLSQVRERVMPALLRIMSDHLGQQIVVVAHNVVNRVLLAQSIDLPLAKARNLSQDNGGINTLRLRNNRLKAVCVNANWHLT